MPCPACGAPNEPKFNFCGECGASLGAAAAPAPAAAAEPSQPGPAATERRFVTVLFADLVGFTTLSETRDAEEVRELLSRYFDAARTVVERYGGVVEKFIGDAVMAVWGTPVTNEDDAERAVRAALELVDQVAELGREVGADLRARAGVNTGEAAVNLAARGQGMVAGDLVNTASRIQSAGEPGSVFVGEATRRATEAAIVYQEAGAHELKGKAESVSLWRALRVVAGRGGLMKSEGLEAPFVGRDREMKLVKDLFHASVEEGRAHLVQLTGIAGIGKSRMVWEFFKYMDGLQDVFFWHRGRCLAYGEGVTYWALAEMVRGRCDILEGEDRASAAAKLHEAVERYVSSPEDRSFVEPRLAHLIGVEERVGVEKNDLFAGWRLFFERLAADRPVLMVFEDVQWADPSLLEFVDYLLDWSRSSPLFVVTAGRPDDRPGLSSTKRNATSIYLEPLPRAAMEAALTGLVPGLPAEITEKILERAEGVPLYAVETVRMLLDRGLLVQEGPVYRPAGPIDALDVPETLQSLIAARLDGLTPDERRTVQDASVLGKTFSAQALAALTEIPREEAESILAALASKEVLSVQADPRSPERGQYGFLQDLVRTVAYETLSKRDRKAKHLRVAEYLEEAWGQDEEEIVEVVASHYVEAYELAPDAEDANRIRDKARSMLVRAAERTASLAAAEEAEAYFRRAAELTDSSLERAELLERAGQMALMRGRPDEAEQDFGESSRLYEEAGQTHHAARVQARLAETDQNRNRMDSALERMRHAYAVLSGDEPDPDLAMVAAQLGRVLALTGRVEEAAPVLEDALTFAEHLQLPEIYSQALNTKALGLRSMGRLDESETLQRRALAVALEHGFTSAALRSYNNLAVILETSDNWEASLELSRAALEFSRRTGHRGPEITWLVGAAGAQFYLGEWDEAVEKAREAMAMEEVAWLEFAAAGLVDIALLYLRRGDVEEANRILDGRSNLETSGHIQLRVNYLAARVEMLEAAGRLDDAMEVLKQILAVRSQVGLVDAGLKRALVRGIEVALLAGDGDAAAEILAIVEGARPGEVTPYLRANAARFAAQLAALRGETESVEFGFIAAARELRELGMRFDLALVVLEHAEWLAGQGRETDAVPLLDEAEELFAGLRAKPWLERVARVARPAEVPAEVGES